MNTILNLKPSSLWSHFSAICAIPHISGDEKRLCKFIMDFCEKNSIECAKDSTGNLLIKKNASSADLDSAPRIILQAHLDMVPQADTDVAHDFKVDSITPVIDDGWVRAQKTTLGADNGIGLAAILAIMESDYIPHGPLSAILTVEEETGLSGVNSIDPEWLDGNMMINLDSEAFGELIVGCAGACETLFKLDFKPVEVPQDEMLFCEISVSGMEGGHSGVDIHLDRGNAIDALFSLVAEFADTNLIYLHSLDGGSVANAIPRDASAKIAIHSAAYEEISEFVASWEADIKPDAYPNDPNMKYSVVEIPPFDTAMDDYLSMRIFSIFPYHMNGVHKMSEKLPGIVETSSNWGAIKTNDDSITLVTMQRSLIESEMFSLRDEIHDALGQAGFTMTESNSFPPWEPARDSRIRDISVEQYKTLFHASPKVDAIHAGLECGVIGRLKPELDMVSFGPTIKYPHSPKEKVNIASVNEFWRLLTEALVAVARARPACHIILTINALSYLSHLWN